MGNHSNSWKVWIVAFMDFLKEYLNFQSLQNSKIFIIYLNSVRYGHNFFACLSCHFFFYLVIYLRQSCFFFNFFIVFLFFPFSITIFNNNNNNLESNGLALEWTLLQGCIWYFHHKKDLKITVFQTSSENCPKSLTNCNTYFCDTQKQ